MEQAHCLKDAKNSRYKNMDRFSTSHRLLLTGENTLVFLIFYSKNNLTYNYFYTQNSN